MTTKTEEVRPEEGTPTTTPKIVNESGNRTDPREGKPRKVISWLRSCNSEETLATLEEHSKKDLEEILTILNLLQEKTNEALDNRAEKDLEDDVEKLKLLEEQTAELLAQIQSNKERVARKRQAEQQ